MARSVYVLQMPFMTKMRHNLCLALCACAALGWPSPSAAADGEASRGLHEGSPIERWAAAERLAAKGPAALPRVTRALADADPYTRRAGLDTLIAMAQPNHVAAMYPDLDKPRAAQKFRQDTAALVPRVIRLVHDENLWVRCGAAEALGAIGPRSTPAATALAKRALDDDPWFVEHATQALGRMSLDRVDRELLFEVARLGLANDRSKARDGAVQMLMGLGDAAKPLADDIARSVVEPATNGMFHDRPRVEAIKLLKRIDDPRGVGLALAVLNEEGWGRDKRIGLVLPVIRSYGVEAGAAEPALRAILANKPHPRMKKQAEAALRAVTGDAQ